MARNTVDITKTQRKPEDGVGSVLYLGEKKGGALQEALSVGIEKKRAGGGCDADLDTGKNKQIV